MACYNKDYSRWLQEKIKECFWKKILFELLDLKKLEINAFTPKEFGPPKL